MSIKLETDKGFQKRRTLKEETTLCSKFTMEYESIYYCWLVDPCVEDVAEAPHFLASKPCGADASTCEPLPSEYEHCRDWHQPNGVQSCTDYGPISSCCKYRTCNEGQICVDLVPNAAYCTTPKSLSPSQSPSPSTAEVQPPIRVMPPHAPPPPPPPAPPPPAPPPAPIVVTSPSPSPVVEDAVVESPAINRTIPDVSLSPAVNTSSPTETVLDTVPLIASPTSPSLAINTTPLPTPSINPVPSFSPPSTSLSPRRTSQSPFESSMELPSAPSQPPAVAVPQDSPALQPTWTTALIIIAVSGVVLLIIALILDRDRNSHRDQERLPSTDDTLAIDQEYWRYLNQPTHSTHSLFTRQLSQTRGRTGPVHQLPYDVH